MSEYNAVLKSIKKWDVSLQYGLVRELLQSLRLGGFDPDIIEARASGKSAVQTEELDVQWARGVTDDSIQRLFTPVDFQMPMISNE